ncbi:MAG: hypothetical protein LBE70_04870 [Nitrososphaerota archaeon]|jgi:hypothetical protein|nr:hypothetical protein [Nitrososphaerota archaeon]
MVEEITTQCLQEQVDNAKQAIVLQDQLDKIKRIIDHGFLWTFIAGVIGSLGFWVILCLNALRILPDNPLILTIGMVVFCWCVGFCTLYVQNAKTEYKKLLEQLQQIHKTQK